VESVTKKQTSLVIASFLSVALRAGFSPLFLCLRASRSVPSATRETAAKVVVRQDGSSFFLSSDRPQAVHNGRGSSFFCFSIVPALPLMTRGELLRSRPLRCRPLSPCRGAAFVKASKKNIARRGRLAVVWLLYFILWEAVHHVDVLFGAGGGALAVLQHVFPVALVGVAAGLAGGGSPAPFFRHRFPS
jgi:hypothetical protein